MIEQTFYVSSFGMRGDISHVSLPCGDQHCVAFFLAKVLLAMAASWFYCSYKEADWL